MGVLVPLSPPQRALSPQWGWAGLECDRQAPGSQEVGVYSRPVLDFLRSFGRSGRAKVPLHVPPK